MPPEIIASLILAFLFLLFLFPNIKIVKENEALVIERFGAFNRVIDQPGIHFLFPLVDREIQKESLLPQTRNLTISDLGQALSYTYVFKIIDIKMYCYKATEPLRVMEEQMKVIVSEEHNPFESVKALLLDFGVELISINEKI